MPWPVVSARQAEAAEAVIERQALALGAPLSRMGVAFDAWLEGGRLAFQHPAGLTHRVVDAATQAQHGITPGLLRLSVGIEHVEDVWDDLRQALDAARLSAAA